MIYKKFRELLSTIVPIKSSNEQLQKKRLQKTTLGYNYT
jgi:hypothetical protein